jgi:tetratricopeptide (TPR) repeat protein
VKRTLLIVALSTAAFFLVSVSAQEGHQHKHEPAEKLGQVNFTVSCNPQAQKQFNRAVAWLHSFEYEEAEKTFNEVVSTDPRCGMGYWGVAMSRYHTIWTPPSVAELQQGWSAIEKAKATGARTQRERDYIAALEVFYSHADKLDHRTRSFAYSDAMQQLARRYPGDDEAAVFYALTLIATGMMENNKDYARQKEAARILNRVLAREPQHPGVTHYLIHSYDYPGLAQLALPAARSYAKIAPASAHARHMPSHIFIRLGLWQEAIRSNLYAESAAKAFAVRNHMSGSWDERLHAMDYLAYAYLQSGQDKQALRVLNEMHQIPRVEPETFKVAYAAAAIPARYALERRQWNEAARLALPESEAGNADGPSIDGYWGAYWKTFPWQRFRWAVAHLHFARAVGAARSGDMNGARNEIAKLGALRQELVAVKGDYDWSKQVEIERMIASAWLAHAEGKREESLRVMRAAADLDDATEKHPVTPGAILPAREQLGELLLELNQPKSALPEFESSLRITPNRFNSLYGAARAARLANDAKTAKTYYARLVELTRQADGIRPEIEEARTFLAGAQRTAKRR